MHIHSQIAPFESAEVSSESERATRADTPVEIRSACPLGIEFAVAASSEPGEVLPSAWVDSVPFGEWIHVFHDGHWLATVWVVAREATLTLGPTCDGIEVAATLHDGTNRQFAIHWELEGERAPDVARGQQRVIPVWDVSSESWLSEQEAGIELPLTNWCGEALDYAFTPTADETPTRHSTLPALTQRVVEVPSGWWLHHRRRADDAWHAAVSTREASTLWLAANCSDHGVGFGAGIDAIESWEGGRDR